MLRWGDIRVGDNKPLDYEVNFSEKPDAERGLNGGKITTMIILDGDDWLYSFDDGKEDTSLDPKGKEGQIEQAKEYLMRVYN